MSSHLSIAVWASMVVLYVATPDAVAQSEPTAQLDAAFAAQRLRSGSKRYLLGRFSMEYSSHFYPMEPSVDAALEDYFVEAVRESMSRYHAGSPPTGSQIDAILQQRAAEHASLVRQETAGPTTHGGPFEFSVHEGVFDYHQVFDPEVRLEDDVIESNVYLQVNAQDYIYSFATAGDEKDEIATAVSVTIGRTSEDTVVRNVPAPYWSTYFRGVSRLASSMERQPRLWKVDRDPSSSTIVALARVTSPQGPWPDVSRPPLCLVSGEFEVVLDADHGGLLSYTVTNARGQVVEQLEASNFVGGIGGATPLKVEHRTFWPSDEGQLRSVARYTGSFSENESGPRPRSILIPPGSRVIDTRVDPAIEYVEGLIPVDDQRLASIAAEAAVERELHPVPSRVDTGEGVTGSSSASAAPPAGATDSEGEAPDGRWRRWTLATAGLLVAAIAFRVALRKS